MSANQKLLSAYLTIPYPLSKWLYTLAKPRFFPDRRAPLFQAVFEQVSASGIQGDYLEFGVFRGSSFITAYKTARRLGVDALRFFAFDSFKGLPHAEGRVMKRGAYASPKSIFHRMIRKAGVRLEDVHTVEGFYTDSLTEEVKLDHNLTSAAVVHIDSDLYSSACEVLTFIEGLLQPGSLLIFDNWYSFRQDGADIEAVGERRAFKEWPHRDWYDDFFDIVNVSKAFIMR